MVGHKSKTSGNASEDAWLMRSSRHIRFVPARRDGRPIGIWHHLVVNMPTGVRAESMPSPDLVGDFGFDFSL